MSFFAAAHVNGTLAQALQLHLPPQLQAHQRQDTPTPPMPLAAERAAFAAFIGRCWQPIDSAPRSTLDEFGRVKGIYLLVWEPAAGWDEPYTDPQIGVHVAWWEPLMCKGAGCWYDGHVERNPTFWMPLPCAARLGG